MKLMLHPKWPGPFRRSIKVPEGDGGLTKTNVLVFAAHEPIEVTDFELQVLQADIGKALVVPQYATAKADFAATEEVATCDPAKLAALASELSEDPALASELGEDPALAQVPAEGESFPGTTPGEDAPQTKPAQGSKKKRR